MEFHIKNPYIKKFLAKYSNQNELKVLKYLTIIGVYHLESQFRDGLSYNELKRMARDISSVVPKEDKEINHELQIIKSELARLNDKFEEKLRTTEVPIIPEEKVRNVRSSSVPRKTESSSVPRRTETMDARSFAKLPSSRWRSGEQGSPERGRFLIHSLSPEEKRATSNEPTIHPPWWDQGHNDVPDTRFKRRNSLTPKINEVLPPTVEIRENRRLLSTKHHLDDSESRKAMNDGGSGAMYFPKKEEEKKPVVQHQVQTQPVRSTRPPKAVDRSERFEPAERPKSRSGERQSTSFTKPDPLSDNEFKGKRDFYSPQNNVTKSPQFAQNREDIMRNMLTASQHNRENHPAAANTGKFGYAHVPLDDIPVRQKASPAKENRNSKKGRGSKKTTTQKPVRERSRSRAQRVGMNQTHFCDLKNVNSKIRDEVNYHKELSKQYKKMKQNLHHYDGYVDVIDASQDLNKDKFELVEPRQPYPYQYYKNVKTQGQPRTQGQSRSQLQQNQSHNMPESQDNSKLIESVSSAQKSLNIGSYANTYDRTPNHNNSEYRGKRDYERNDEYSNYKQSGETNQGGMLDIANSFLNSPLMHHLSHMDSKNSEDISSKESSNPNTLTKNYSGVRINNFDPKSPSGYQRSPNKRYEVEDDSKVSEGPHHQHKYSDWVGNYRNDGRENNSNLKDSTNRRYGEYTSKDSRILNKDDGSSSLTSSNFSNFLNEEMKGFYQKETFDLRKSKNSRSMRHAGSSEHSSNISFNHGQEAHPTPGDHTHFHSRKSTYLNTYDNNKSYVGNSYDQGNIFKNERMSVTRLLNNTNY